MYNIKRIDRIILKEKGKLEVAKQNNLRVDYYQGRVEALMEYKEDDICKLLLMLKVKGLTQSEVAKKVGLTRQRINQYCSKENFNLTKPLKDIAKLIDVNPEELLDEKGI